MALPLLYPRTQWMREHAATPFVLVPGTPSHCHTVRGQRGQYDRHPEINRGWEECVARVASMPGFVMETEHGFPCQKDSTQYELAGGSFLEKDEVRQMVAWARDLHIQVIPEVPSLSHAYYLCYPHPEIAENTADPLPDTHCPSNPSSYTLRFDVINEVLDVFTPRLVHMGHDEVHTLGVCPHCRD